jgi:hypothetical protein
MSKDPNAVKLGRLGGMARSEKKAAASRINGRKGACFGRAKCMNCERPISVRNKSGVCSPCQRKGFRPGLKVSAEGQGDTGSTLVELVTRGNGSPANLAKDGAPPTKDRVTWQYPGS